MTPTGFFFFECVHKNGRIDYFIARDFADLFDRHCRVIGNYHNIRRSAPVCIEHFETIDKLLKVEDYGKS